MGNPLANIRIVLVSPIYGGNVGAVCRAMKNMGLSHLVIAGPRAALDVNETLTMAYRAGDVFEARREYPTLAEAVADCGLVAGTTARVGLYRSHSRTPRDWAPELLKAAETTQVALVFGPEDKGLDNDQLSLCTQIIQIPSSPDYLSINLSHAVMICCYELFVASGQFEGSTEPFPEASSAARERMFAMWEDTLLAIGFMKEEKAQHMMLGLRRILSRGKLTDADVRILMGIARQAAWYARRSPDAGKAPPEES
ncbi:MAG: RNA methyltransferase [Kiritimatiellae bacterium]|nr:RNA methyltransferase [Kiritimatiellia bacterium]